MRDTYFRTAEGFVFVYAVNNKPSLEEIKDLFETLITSRVSYKVFKEIICLSMHFRV